MHVKIADCTLKDINRFKGLKQEDIKKWLAENTFEIWRQVEIKVIQSGKDEGKLRWPDKQFVAKILHTKEIKFREYVKDICNKHNALPYCEIKSGIPVLKEFASLLENSEEVWRGSGKVSALVANKNSRKIKQEIKETIKRKRNEVKTDEKDDKIEWLQKKLKEKTNQEQMWYQNAAQNFDKSKTPAITYGMVKEARRVR